MTCAILSQTTPQFHVLIEDNDKHQQSLKKLGQLNYEWRVLTLYLCASVCQCKYPERILLVVCFITLFLFWLTSVFALVEYSSLVGCSLDVTFGAVHDILLRFRFVCRLRLRWLKLVSMCVQCFSCQVVHSFVRIL